MRTTIEIPGDLKQKLAAEALSRNMKGYSKIIIEALQDYFKNGKSQKKEVIKSLKGCLSAKERREEEVRLKEGRKNWRD